MMKVVNSLVFSSAFLFAAQQAQAHMAYEKYAATSNNGVKLNLDFQDSFLTKSSKKATLCLIDGTLNVTTANFLFDGAEDELIQANIEADPRERCAILKFELPTSGEWQLELIFNNGDEATFTLAVGEKAIKSSVGAGKEIYTIFSAPIDDNEQTVKFCNAFHEKFMQIQLWNGMEMLDLPFTESGHACVIAEGLAVAPGSTGYLLIIAFEKGEILTLDL